MHDGAVVIAETVSTNVLEKVSFIIVGIASIEVHTFEGNVVFSIGSCVLVVKPFNIHITVQWLNTVLFK